MAPLTPEAPMTTTTPLWQKVTGWLALALHGAIFIWYAASGLVAPGWAVGVLLALWAALAVVAVVLLRRRPVLVPVVPIAAACLWFAAVWAGGEFLGWTA